MICPTWKIICDYEVLHHLTVRLGEKRGRRKKKLN